MRTLKEVCNDFDLNAQEEIESFGIPGELSDRDIAISMATVAHVCRKMGLEDCEQFNRVIRQRIESSKLFDQPAVILQTALFNANRAVADQLKKLFDDLTAKAKGSTGQDAECYAIVLDLIHGIHTAVRDSAMSARAQVLELLHEKEAA